VAVAGATAAAAVDAAADAVVRQSSNPERKPMKSRTEVQWAPFLLVSLAMLLPCAPSAQAAEAKAAKQAAALPAHRSFTSPEDAAKALVESMRAGDLKGIYAVLGPGSGKLIFTGDKVADKALRDQFVAAYEKSMKLEREGDAKATLLIGEKDYPFPYPLVKGAAGWRFDAKSGAEEIINRRIGTNELAAIQVCLAYVDAQREYALADRTGNSLPQYAQKIISTKGKHDGLYWPTKAGEPQSPLGPIVSRAKSEGYSEVGGGYYGYRYRILTGQGKDAPGGAYNYVVNGKMIGGFGMVAWPVRWGVSGVMTFICNHDGVVYQKNLGADTATIAEKMTRYNPDSTWKKAEN
jgi:hypothetical protein